MRYIVSKAPEISGPPIPADEPCLVIRAQDILAVHMLRHYIRLAMDLGVSETVIMELYDHDEELLNWRRENSARIKLADR